MSWQAPSSGGSAITGYTVTVRDGAGASIRTIGVGANTFNTTVDTLTNDTPYTFTVKATNAIGAGPDSNLSAAVTPSATLRIRPDITNTGVPIGLAGDPRSPATLTLASTLTPASWFSYGTSSGYPRFVISALPPGGLIENIDFTDAVISITLPLGNTPYGNLTFRNCYFVAPTARPTVPSPTSPFGKPPANLVSVAFAMDGLTFETCTFNGLTYDPFQPISNPVAYPSSVKNVTFDRCYVFGPSNAYVTTNVDGYTVKKCLANNLTSARGGGYVKNITAAPSSGGSLTAGTRYFQVSAVTHSSSLGDQQTALHPFAEVSTDVAASGQVAVGWDQYVPAGGYTVTGYRVYVGTAPGVYDGFFFVAGATTVSAAYTGQALTTTAMLGEYVGSHAHPDCVQIQSDYARRVLIQGNDFFAKTPQGYSNSAGIQIGSMTGIKEVEDFQYLDNWLDGSSGHFNGGTDIHYFGGFVISGNQIGLNYDNWVKTPRFDEIIGLASGVWANNVWASSGINKNGKGVPVLQGQIAA